MDRKTISERLRALACDDLNRSKAARLRDVIDDVESALAAGVPRALVVQELARHGLQMSLATFETSLKRIRCKRANPATPSLRPPKPDTTAPAAQPEPQTDSAAAGSHNPQDLDKIIASKPDLAALAKLAKRTKKLK